MVESKPVKFSLTGFGPFGSVTDNPSKRIAKYLADKFREEPTDSFRIFEYRELEVTTVAANETSSEIIAKIKEDQVENPESTHVVLHLGVSERANTIYLEKFGYNRANFRIPDSSGKVLTDSKINENAALDEPLGTTLLTEECAKELQDEGLKIATSTDPGRYLCNYIYYTSLNHTKSSGIHVMFIHIPTFATLSEDDQRISFERLLAVIAKSLRE